MQVVQEEEKNEVPEFSYTSLDKVADWSGGVTSTAWSTGFFPLTFAEYQTQARTTAFVYQDAIDAMDLAQCRAALKLAYSALGLAGEAGETANKVKKIVRGDGAPDKARVEEILKELGGTLWYMSDIATNLGACLGEDVARRNLEILASRKERGVLKGNGDNR